MRTTYEYAVFHTSPLRRFSKGPHALLHITQQPGTAVVWVVYVLFVLGLKPYVRIWEFPTPFPYALCA